MKKNEIKNRLNYVTIKRHVTSRGYTSFLIITMENYVHIVRALLWHKQWLYNNFQVFTVYKYSERINVKLISHFRY